jgi:hypothetical protein
MSKISIAERAATLLLQYGFTFNQEADTYDYEIELQGYRGVYSLTAAQLHEIKYFNADEFITQITAHIEHYTQKMRDHLGKFEYREQFDEILTKLADLGFTYVKERGEYHYIQWLGESCTGYALHWSNIPDLIHTDLDKWFNALKAQMLDNLYRHLAEKELEKKAEADYLASTPEEFRS